MIFGDPNTNEHCHTHNWTGREGQDCPRCATVETLQSPFAVYEDHEGVLHIIDATTRTVLSDTYAYDRDDTARAAHMEAIAAALTRGWSGGAPPAAPTPNEMSTPGELGVGAARPAEPPPDHESFMEARASGFPALKRALERRKHGREEAAARLIAAELFVCPWDALTERARTECLAAARSVLQFEGWVAGGPTADRGPPLAQR